MANHIFVLVAIMLMTGVFGGLLNYYMQAQVDENNSSMPKSIVAGLFASFLVPLILFLVSSELVDSSQGDPSKILIFASICLIAALASRIFTSTSMTKKVKLESMMAREKADELMVELRILQRELEPLLETETESDDLDESFVLAPEEELDVTTANVLTALGNGRYIFRSLKGLCAETDLDEQTMAKTLSIVVARDLGGKVLTTKGIRWFISQKGRKYLSASN